MIVLTSEIMKNYDNMAIKEYGVPAEILMENAGQGIAHIITSITKDITIKKVLVIAGPGNNGGDGFVVARHLSLIGIQVNIIHFGDKEKASRETRLNIDIAEKMDINIIRNPTTEVLSAYLEDSDVIVDALLGIGVKGNLRDPFEEIIKTINSYSNTATVFAVDVPSGVNTDTGQVTDAAVIADYTICIAAPKPCHFLYPSVMHVGQMIPLPISIPYELMGSAESEIIALDRSTISQFIQRRHPESHKGDFGHLAIIAGSVGMTGAAVLCAEAAIRTGAGLVTVIVPESLNDIMEVKLTEAMTYPVPEAVGRCFGKESIPKILKFIERADAIVLGPGIGRSDHTVNFVHELIPKIKIPAVIDADALYAISKKPDLLFENEQDFVLTPHMGEMSMLTETSIYDIQSNKLSIAKEYAGKYGVTLVLKGAGTIIADADEWIFINTTGTPGLASGGTGDVLTGMIASFMAQGFDGVDAANCGVWMHGLAGEIAEKELGESSMCATDVIDNIPNVFKEILENSYEYRGD
ncbi:MAG: NAD(P)H-hydrate dehydratase [Armatimonadota bacterium]